MRDDNIVRLDSAIVRSFHWAAAYEGTSGAPALQYDRHLACEQLARRRMFFKPKEALMASAVHLGL